MQEADPNTAPRAGSPVRKSTFSAAPSPSQLHKQYWDGVTKRAAAAKPPKSPLPPSGSKGLPGTLSPRRGVSPLSVKVPAKSPLQGVAANLVKGAHNNPLFADAQHTPKAAGWKSIATTEHASKENSAPANPSPRPTDAFGKASPKPTLKSPTDNLLIPLSNQGPASSATAPVTLTPNPVKPATDSPPKADTVIGIASNQEVKNRVDYALNTPPNTPAQDASHSETANLVNDYPNAVRDNPEYSPSNNPFSPRPEFRRPSLARGATPGRAPLAAQPDWTSLLSAVPPPESPEPKTPPQSTTMTSVSLGGSPRFIEVFLQQPGSERATPRRRLRMSPDDEDDVMPGQDDVSTDDVSTPHPVKSRVRLVLKLLLATVVFMALGGLEMDPGWVPRELKGAALVGRWAPRGLWHGTPGAGRYSGDTWFSNNLFVTDVDWLTSVKHFVPREINEEGVSGQPAHESSAEGTATVEEMIAAPQLPIIRLSFDEYDGPNNLDELVPEEEPSSSATFDEPDPDAGEPDERADVIETEDPDSLDYEDDVTWAAELPDAHAAVSSNAQSADADVRITSWDAVSDDADAVPSVYERQVREAALLEMADVAVRSYTSAFAAALALFAVFSLAAFVGAHFFPAPTAGRDDVRGASDDVSQEEDDVIPAEVTTPMFLRQGVRMEEPVVVTPANSALGSPFGRYQAFVRHMIGQNTESPQLVLTPVQRSRRLADKFRSVAGSPSHRFTISPA
ncbi:hypothetical protein KFL_006110060 [Klebsormidium nitens]|uniref:Transmembrane protein n=1 Tax=Klebsormidium nitens TaxID=105231 RepID=A0A1Y1IH43_KLENI|nr:hypothetical protein KFL_006110060 [Klebsormidium nitens]|eukprot:GAQ90194.1 hypothetical protein KFL_006110060 [Klebsormidium nitens]